MLNTSVNEVLEKMDNRYYLVSTISKRARDLIDEAKPLVPIKDKEKPVSIATREVCEGKIYYRNLTDEEIQIKEAKHLEEQHKQLEKQEQEV
ncbi:MAG: DNA-directed RNA polymerase subunit omega [Clostridioides sp.]|jgi:DNA-directed RNA polymerase subunit omega|nr:DNA-directed RNA polymerase subunit omega [Clostridioides sp.]